MRYVAHIVLILFLTELFQEFDGVSGKKKASLIPHPKIRPKSFFPLWAILLVVGIILACILMIVWYLCRLR